MLWSPNNDLIPKLKSWSDTKIDINVFDISKYNSFRKAVNDLPKDSETGYVVVPDGLLTKQVELLFSYINDTDHKKKNQQNIDPKLFLNAAFEVINKQGKNALHLAIEKQNHKVSGALINTATPEQLFAQDGECNTALHSAVKKDDIKTALAIVRKEGVTVEHLLLKDGEGNTAAYSVAQILMAISDTTKNSIGFTLKDSIEIADIKKLLKQINKISGLDELKNHAHPFVSSIIEEVTKPDRDKLVVFKGGDNIVPEKDRLAKFKPRPPYIRLAIGYKDKQQLNRESPNNLGL